MLPRTKGPTLMRKRVIALLVALTTALGVGGFALSQATAAPAGKVTASTVLGNSRGWCVRSGTGELRNLWLDPNGKCPAPFWGPTTLGGSSGPTAADIKAIVDSEVAAAIGGLPSAPAAKHFSVKFNADWATNTAIKKIKDPFVGDPQIDSAGYINVSAPAAIGATVEDPIGDQFPATVNPSSQPTDQGQRFYFAIVQSGLPAYSANQRELWGSNVASSSMASESDVQVDGVVQPSIGATTRTFIVSIAKVPADSSTKSEAGTLEGFGNSRAFTVDAWTLVP